VESDVVCVVLTQLLASAWFFVTCLITKELEADVAPLTEVVQLQVLSFLQEKKLSAMKRNALYVFMVNLFLKPAFYFSLIEVNVINRVLYLAVIYETNIRHNQAGKKNKALAV
jgi:hypothetical protein